MARKNLKLVDTEAPNLYREIFPYSEFPKVHLRPRADRL
jgi:hypothetical protein